MAEQDKKIGIETLDGLLPSENELKGRQGKKQIAQCDAYE